MDDLVRRLQTNYSHVYGSGLGKKHGCAIFFNKRLFEKTHRLILHFDELSVHEAEDDNQPANFKRGMTRKTNNIGLAVVLRCLDDPTKGCIVATLHAFWHPASVLAFHFHNQSPECFPLGILMNEQGEEIFFTSSQYSQEAQANWSFRSRNNALSRGRIAI